MDGRIEDGPVDDDYDDVEDEASGVEKLQQPKIPGRGSISLSPKVVRSEPGEPVGVPSVQGEVAAEEKGADVGEKEKELDSRFMRSEMESEDESHGQIKCAKEPKNEETEGGQAPGRVPGV